MRRELWIPRILSIIFILFLSLFALDVFGTDLSFFKQLGGFFVNLLLPIILILVLIVFWKNPTYCGLSYIIIAVSFTFFFKTYTNVISFILISFLPAFIGFLFLIFRDSVKSN
ncbi:MAG: hypothetical protein U5K53_06780 [Halanaerobiales bacterium]|nr:hypothetical protein [Halanaerobiales bacterium]